MDPINTQVLGSAIARFLYIATLFQPHPYVKMVRSLVQEVKYRLQSGRSHTMCLLKKYGCLHLLHQQMWAIKAEHGIWGVPVMFFLILLTLET